MYLPIAILENKRIQRLIFSIRSSSSQSLFSLMEKIYEKGGWCFHLPSTKHLDSFQRLRESTGAGFIMGFGQVEAESGVSLIGKPLHQFESKVVSTIAKTIVPPDLVRRLFPGQSLRDILTQKEIDRIMFDPSRFDQALSAYQPEEVPFLLLGGKYGDWLFGLGRSDLLKEMVSAIRKKGFIPIFLGQWTTFVLPKAKPLEVAAFAIPVNKKKILFDLEQACKMVKQFDKPIISLDPLSGGDLVGRSEEAFSFLFDELKVHSVMAEINSEDEIQGLLRSVENIPSLIPFRKT